MFQTTALLRCTFLFSCLALLGAKSVHASFSDRVEADAILTPAAMHALLLDITHADQRLVAVGEQGAILLSDDQGQQWRQVPTPVSVLLTAVSFPSANHGWTVGHDGVVLKTTDAGSSWTAVLNAHDLNRLRVEQLEAAYSKAESEGSDTLDGLEYALDDARFALSDGAMPPLLDVLFLTPDEGFVVGAYGQLYRTLDGGQQWQTLGHRLPNPDGLHLNKIEQDSRGDLYIVGEAGIVMRSRDRGEQWERVESPYDGSFFSVIEHEYLYLLGLRGNVFQSLDRQQWQPVSLPKRATLNAAVSNGSQLFLLGQGGLLLQKDHRGFRVFSEELKRSLVAGVIAGNALITVGSGGINRLMIDSEK